MSKRGDIPPFLFKVMVKIDEQGEQQSQAAAVPPKRDQGLCDHSQYQKVRGRVLNESTGLKHGATEMEWLWAGVLRSERTSWVTRAIPRFCPAFFRDLRCVYSLVMVFFSCSGGRVSSHSGCRR